jgi:hypothetical protein
MKKFKQTFDENGKIKSDVIFSRYEKNKNDDNYKVLDVYIDHDFLIKDYVSIIKTTAFRLPSTHYIKISRKVFFKYFVKALGLL